MRTEKEKMLAGEPYFSSDPELAAERLCAHALCRQFNAMATDASAAERHAILARLFGADSDVHITPPFFCDYGRNIRLGKNVHFNFNCIVLDVAPVSIGDNSLFGPAVQIYTALHPLAAAERRSGIESGKPVTVGNDVWIGGGAIVCPGIIIGDGAVVGAGSVVTRDIPAKVFAAGNPCRVIRTI